MRKTLPLLLLTTASVLLGWFLHRPAERIEWKEKVVVKVEHRTDTIVETVPVYIEKVRTEEKLVYLHDTLMQTVPVYVPIEHRHEKFEHGEVWYHGYEAGIDSLLAYKHTQIITIERTQKERPSRWGVGLSAGYGVGKSGLTPYIGVGIEYRLLSFPGRERRRERGLDYD